MRTWWVNHKQTASQEILGGFLWSPKFKNNGHRNQFYENMRKTRPGDFVVSYANGEIRYLGIVTGLPRTAPRPADFGRVGENWSNDGWHVRVSWSELQTRIQPKEHFDRIRPLLPEKYSPLHTATGNGSQHAYLSRIDYPLFDELMKLGMVHPADLARQTATIDEEKVFEEDEERIDETEKQIQADIEADTTLDQTMKQAIIQARRGQGIFRRRVKQIEPRCRVTGLKDGRLLIASHIKPWRDCETTEERLDGLNGLLLAPHIDRLFDKGLISFERNGRLMLSDTVDSETVESLGLSPMLAEGIGAFSEAQEVYLAFHRDNVFRP